MNQLEQQTEDWLNEILGNVEGQYSSHDGKIREIVKDIFQAGQQAERESTNNIITKERDTWARESIGDKALQSLEIALINSKE